MIQEKYERNTRSKKFGTIFLSFYIQYFINIGYLEFSVDCINAY